MAARQANPFTGRTPDICYIRLEFKSGSSNKFYEITLGKANRELNAYRLEGVWGAIGAKKPGSKVYRNNSSLIGCWDEAQVLFAKKFGKGYKIVAAKFGVDNAKDAEIQAVKQQEKRSENRFFNLV